MSHRRKVAAKRRENLAPPVVCRHWAYGPVVLAIILLTTVLVYWPAMHGDFLWDDDANVTSPELQSPAGLVRIWFEFGATQQYYPLLHTAFWLEHAAWGDSPTDYHVISLIWHLLSVVLVYAIFNRLKIPGALFGAAIFALHPVMVESVAWITEQKNTLSTVFYLSSMLAYLHFDESRKRSTYLASLGLFVLALFSKSAIVTLPAALLVIFWWQRGTLSWRRDVLPLTPFFVAAILIGVITCWVEWNHVGAVGADFKLTFLQRLLLAGRAVWFYLGKLFWPRDLIFMYPRWVLDPHEARQWLDPLAVFATTAVLWAIRGRSRSPLAAWLFFCGTLLPMLGLLNQYLFLYTFVSDHFQYVASLGIIALVTGSIGAFLARVPRIPRILFDAACVCLIALVAYFITYRQCLIYADVITLYQSTLDRNPNCWMMHNNLGAQLHQKGNYQDAIKHYETALSLRPKFPQCHNNLAFALIHFGNYQEARDHLEQALQIKPDYAAARNNLGLALSGLGKTPEAIEQFRLALSTNPRDASARGNLGAALAEVGDLNGAVAEYQTMAEQFPDRAEVHLKLADLIRLSGKSQEAIEQYQTAVRLNPKSVEAYAHLAQTLAVVDRSQDAIASAEQGIDAARSTGQESVAEEIEDWLKHYRTELKRAADAAAPSK